MAQQATQTVVQGLPTFSRHITTHNADGIAVFETTDPANSPSSSSSGARSLPAEPSWSNFPTSGFGLGYATDDMPPDFNGDADLATFNKYQQQHPGIVIKGGSVFRVVDMAPGAASPMHRTVSIPKKPMSTWRYPVVTETENRSR